MREIVPHAQLVYQLRIGTDEFKSDKWLDHKIFGSNLASDVKEYFHDNYRGWYNTGYASGEDGWVDFFFVTNFPQSGERFYNYLKEKFDR